ncbi:hypothetical protein BOX15_Mlig015534g1, partial [Macrostomum lignano]
VASGMQSNHTGAGLAHHSSIVVTSSSVVPAVSAPGRLGNSVPVGTSSFAIYPAMSAASTFDQQQQQQQQHQQQIALHPSAEVAGSNSLSASSVKMNSALSYLTQVKRRLASDSPAIYNGFIDALRDFKAGKIDPQAALSRVRQLFRSYPDLVTGFVAFLPAGMSVSSAQNPPPPAAASQQSYPRQSQKNQQQQQQQPQEEFNHAIAYVNKIKSRFAGRSAVYKQFLEILHRYQKEQRTGRVHSEAQVMAELGRLFGGQSDLLEEFSLFLPHRQQQMSQADPAAAVSTQQSQPPPQPLPAPSIPSTILAPLLAPRPTALKRPRPASPSQSSSSLSSPSLSTMPKRRIFAVSTDVAASNSPLVAVPSRIPARPPLYHHHRQVQRRRRPRHPPVRAPSPKAESLLADAAKFDAEAARFLERLEAAIGEQEVYANFLRCLNLYATGRVGRLDFLERAAAFLRPFPDLLAWLQADLAETTDSGRQKRRQQQQPEQTPEIDSLKLQISGGSYRAAPRSFAQPRCSGRDHLPAACREALNDTLVSFPNWLSEESRGGGRRNQHEEACCRVEDERYELDMVLEVNQAAIRALEAAYRRLQRLPVDELVRHRLGEDLCGGSAVLQRQAIYRVYGDKAHVVIQCLQENPAVAVPLILRRLKAKADEWKEAQKAFNRVWREQIDRNYAKSLDHQGQAFKQLDLRQMRTRALVNDISTRPDQTVRLAVSSDSAAARNDAVDLLALQAKRLAGVGQEERAAVRRLLRCWLRDVTGDDRVASDSAVGESDADESRIDSLLALEDAEPLIPTDRRPLLGNSAVYSFLRLFHMLAERLGEVKLAAAEAAAELAPTATSTAARSAKTYAAFLQLATSLINTSLDPASFEERVRHLLGSRCYRIFTLDRLLSLAVRQLHSLVTEEASRRLLRQFYATRPSVAAAIKGETAGAAVDCPPDGNRRVKSEQQLESQEQQQLYRISLDQRDRILSIRLLATAELQQSSASSTAASSLQQQQQQQQQQRHAAATPSVMAMAAAAQHWSRYLLDLQRDASSAIVNACRPPLFLGRNRRRSKCSEDGRNDGAGRVSCWDRTELRLAEHGPRLRLVQAAGSESLFCRWRSPAAADASASVVRRRQLGESLRRLSWSASPAEESEALAWLLGETPGLVRPGLRTVRLPRQPAGGPASDTAGIYRTEATDPAVPLWPVNSQADLAAAAGTCSPDEADEEPDEQRDDEAGELFDREADDEDEDREDEVKVEDVNMENRANGEQRAGDT